MIRGSDKQAHRPVGVSATDEPFEQLSAGAIDVEAGAGNKDVAKGITAHCRTRPSGLTGSVLSPCLIERNRHCDLPSILGADRVEDSINRLDFGRDRQIDEPGISLKSSYFSVEFANDPAGCLLHRRQAGIVGTSCMTEKEDVTGGECRPFRQLQRL